MKHEISHLESLEDDDFDPAKHRRLSKVKCAVYAIIGHAHDPVDIICGVDRGNILDVNGKKYHVDIPKESVVIDAVYDDIARRPEKFESYLLTKEQDKGVYEMLWDIFGGTVNEQGYKVLDPHIGVIYGDSITIQRQREIYRRLEPKSLNIIVTHAIQLEGIRRVANEYDHVHISDSYRDWRKRKLNLPTNVEVFPSTNYDWQI